jgi:hypothetical protein
MGERFKELPTRHLSFTALVITLMMYSAFTKVNCHTMEQHMKMSVISLNIAQKIVCLMVVCFVRADSFITHACQFNI